MSKSKAVEFGDLEQGEIFRIGRKKAKWMKDGEGGAVLVSSFSSKDKLGALEWLNVHDKVFRDDMIIV